MSDDISDPKFNTRNSGQAYQELSKSLASSPDVKKIEQDRANGTLDDHVDIDDTSYNEAKAKAYEQEYAKRDGIEPLPEDPVLQDEATSYAIENPNDPDPF